MPRSYWIAHPTELAFISALSPEGIGQVLLMAECWPPGLYAIQTHRHTLSTTGPHDRHWGHAVKDRDGNVWIESGPRE
jgi:hypothetical protein